MRKSYQGQHSLEGNQCSEYLKKLENLEIELRKEPSEMIEKTVPFLNTLKAFRKVQESCFGMDIKGDYRKHIEEFSRTYRELNISVTPKVFFYI